MKISTLGLVIWRWLKPRERVFLILLSISQVLLGILDLVAIGLIGVITSVTTRSLTDREAGDNSLMVLKILNLSDKTTEAILGYLGILSFMLLVTKSLTSYYLTRKSISFLARKNAELSVELLRQKSLAIDSQIHREVPENVRFNVVEGSNALMIGVLGGMSGILSDLATLTFLFLGMTFISPSTSLLMFGLFATLVILLSLRNHKSATNIGEKFAILAKEGNEIIVQAVQSYRELYAVGLLDKLMGKFSVNRKMYGKTVAAREMIPFQGKYVFEIAALVVSFGVLIFQLSVSETTRAIATFAVFFSATLRIAPSSMRIYQGFTTVKINRNIALSSKEIFEELLKIELPGDQLFNTEFEKTKILICAKSIHFNFVDSEKPLFSIESFEVRPKEFVGIMGKSGVGKSTFLDLILGIHKPSKGKVLIGGLEAPQFTKRNPGSIAYVPQRPYVISGSIRRNLTFGNLLSSEISDNTMEEKLRLVGMFNNADILLDREASTLSGGQLQRLALARALLSKPQVLILDEPSSGLDTSTQLIWNKLFKKLTQNCSLIVVSHREEILDGADRLYILSGGQLRMK